jgi:uncharacterized protein YutE (UPF0331/DUF86 family)
MPMPEPRPDPEILRRKIQFVRDSVRHLESIRSSGKEEFLSSHILQAAAVRNLQVAIEAILDAANHIIAHQQLGLPSTYLDAIEILLEHGILPRERQADLANMVRFRNRAVHLYDEILPAEIWKILESHLGDFEIVLQAFAARYF